jgi:hypothetical protein
VDRIEELAARSLLGKVNHYFRWIYLKLDLFQTNFGHGDDNMLDVFLWADVTSGYAT